MKLIRFFKRAVTTAAILLVVSVTAMADTTHIVDRGETLHSIAQKYGVTPEQIIGLNPQAAQFVYVGMELKIPSAATTSPSQSQSISPTTTPQTSQQSSGILMASTPSGKSDNNDNWILNQWGIDYIANFSSNGKGYYGLFFESLGPKGWGGFISFGASYGIIKPGQFHFRFGPDYGVKIGESSFLSLPVTVTLTTFEHTKKETINGKLDKPITSSDIKTGWGIAATPKIALKVDKIYLNAGIDINYSFKKTLKTEYEYKNLPLEDHTKKTTYGGKAYVGFFVGIGI